MTAIYKKAWVLGLGASGLAAAKLLACEGVDVVVIDSLTSSDLATHKVVLERYGVRVLLAAEKVPEEPADICIVSPGVSPTSSLFQAVKQSNVPMLSELELGWSRSTCPVLAVTGSNGKSTAVKAVAHILNESGVRAGICGNYGPPVCDVVKKSFDWLVMEVSSFQLETVDKFRPNIGLMLNVLPNHLDRHRSMDAYAKLKSRLFAQSQPNDLCLVQEKWLHRMKRWSGGQGTWLSFGQGGDLRYESGLVLEGDQIVANVSDTYFDTPVLGSTIAAVMRAVHLCGVSYSQAANALCSFEPLPHRLQVVARVHGLTFINDSKSTNLAALAAAIQQSVGNIRLLAGGVAKENDFAPVKDLLAERVSAVYLLGQSSKAMALAWSSEVSCVCCNTLERAFERVMKEAQEGDTVLLSPGCASLDQFRNYEERGKCFMELVKGKAAGVV